MNKFERFYKINDATAIITVYNVGELEIKGLDYCVDAAKMYNCVIGVWKTGLGYYKLIMYSCEDFSKSLCGGKLEDLTKIDKSDKIWYNDYADEPVLMDLFEAFKCLNK